MRTPDLPQCPHSTWSILRRALPALMLTLALVVPAPGVAATATFGIGIDSDSNPATGCTLATANGTVAGVEIVARSVVTTSASGATVTRLEQQRCNAGSLSASATYETGGWPVGFGNGTGGSAVIEYSVPLSALGATGAMRAVAFGADGSGGQDATSPFTIAVTAPAASPVVPVPLSPWLVLPLSLLLAGAAAAWRRRHPDQTALLVLLVFVAGSGLVWAATVLRDGNVGDWAGVSPAVTDAKGDAPANADIVAVFVQQDGVNLYVRIDADVRKDAAANQAPVVNAGTAQTVTLPAAATLSGSATDDGLPNPPGALTYAWSKVSGPGTVSFGNATSAATTATFSVAGGYVLRLTANDSALAATGDVTITVSPAGAANQAPLVNAGGDQAITLPAGANLAGSATDDGLPSPPGALTYAWSKVSGPGTVNFGNAANASTTASFSAAGAYVLQLTASDGALSAADEVTVNASPVGTANQPPIASAGSPQTTTLPGSVLLTGGATDDGMPNPPGNLSFQWNKLSGPGGVTFGNAAAAVTAASFDMPGSYVLRLGVSDGHLTATADVSVTVKAGSGADQAPVVSAGPGQTVPLLGNATLSGTVVDDGLPSPGSLSYQWTRISGPGSVSFADPTATKTTATFTQPGTYVLRLMANDGANSAFDDVLVTAVQAAAQAAPVAVDDTYEVRVGERLTVPAPGVLANDLNPGGSAIAARKLSDPAAGSVTAFAADGSFTFKAPASPPGVPLATTKTWNGNATWSYGAHDVIGDLNGDGYPDVISHNLNADIRARSGQDAAELWALDVTGATDCQVMTGGGMNHRVLADIDDSGRPAYVLTTKCAREGSNWHDHIIAFDHLGKVKWVSPPLSKPHPDIRRGATPVPPGGFTPGGLAWRRGLSAARLTANGAPVLLMRAEITNNDGYTYYVDAANQFHYAGCRAVTGFVADENRACRATLIISGTDGSVLQTLVAPNPTGTGLYGGPDAIKELPPIAFDVDGDGRIDLVSGTEVWKQNASGGFDLAWQLTTSVNDTAVADLDGDGKAEIVFIRNGSIEPATDRGIFVYGHDGQLLRRIPLPAYWMTPLTIADVDRDGRSDIVVGADGTLYAFRDDGRPIWAYKVPEEDPDNATLAPIYTQPAEGFRTSNAAPQVYDLDGDGLAEVVFAAHSRIMIVDGRTGLRKVDPYWTYSNTYADVSALMLIDMNNDGHVDIVQNGAFLFNCGFVGFPPGFCNTLVGPIVLSGGSGNAWLPGPKAWPHIQYRSTSVDDRSRLVHDVKVSRVFRTPEQQGTVRDPRLAQAASFTYEADDSVARSAPAKVIVNIVPDNKPPVFTSVPPKSLWQRFAPNPPGGLVTNYYDLAATDPDPGDTITFSLKSAPAWVTMSGPARIRFEPTCGSYGYPCPWGWTTVIVTATDSRGAATDQIFIVNLTTDATTVPDVVGQLLDAAKVSLLAADLQGVVTTEAFSAQPAGTVLAQEAVAGATVGRDDDVRLTVSKGAQPVAMPFVVGQSLSSAVDLLARSGLAYVVTGVPSTSVPAGEIIAQSPVFGSELVPGPASPVSLTVSSGGPLAQPVASIVLEPGPGPHLRIPGDALQFKAVAIFADGTSADVSLKAVWSATAPSVAAVGAAGLATARAAGSSVISAALNGKTGQVKLDVAVPSGDTMAPTAVVDASIDGAVVVGPTPVIGTAADTNFLRYEVAYATDSAGPFAVFAEGTAPVTGGALGTFDPTLLENGAYVLRLTVWDRGGNTTSADAAVRVEGARKVGAFTIAYTDLTVPLAGIPIEVVRTYDSRKKRMGDFGVGWNISLKSVKVSAARKMGAAWEVQKPGSSYQLVPRGEHAVTVTLPDGRTETFDLKLTPSVSPFIPLSTLRASFLPRSGNRGMLELVGNADLLVVDPQPGVVTLIDDTTLETFDPDRFRYRQQDGTEFIVTRSRGVESVEDANGNRIAITEGGLTHSSGAAVVFTRDAKGRIAGIVDPLGRTIAYEYSDASDLVRVTDRERASSRYFYDRHHGLLRVEDAMGRTPVRAEYDDDGRLTALTDANGEVTRYRHDLPGRQELIEDALGRVTVLNHDERGNVTAVTDPMGRTRTMTYDARGNLLTRTDPLGNATSFSYDANDAVVAVTDALGRTTRFARDAAGRVTDVTNPRGYRTRITYDASGNVIGVADALGGVWAYAYDASGNPQATVDPLGNVVRNAYDASGRHRELVFEDGATITYQHDAAGRLVRQVGSTGSAVVLTYDAEGRIVGSQRPGLQRTLELDASGRLEYATTATNQRMAVKTDAVGRLGLIEDPTAGPVLMLTYDAVGNLTGLVDATGNATTSTFDRADQMVRRSLPGGATRTFSYDAAGRMTLVTDVLGRSTRLEYDPAGRVVAAVDTAGSRTTYSYDANGNLESETDALGRVSAHEYDALDRRTRTTHPDGTFRSTRYDAAGRVAAVTDEAGRTTSFTYDAAGRLVAVVDASGVVTRHAYGTGGGRSETVDGNGNTTRYEYDSAGRLTKRAYPSGAVETITYDPGGRVLSTTNGAGETIRYQYDARGRRSAAVLPSGVSETYTYTVDHLPATATDARGTITFEYDANTRRLVRVTEPDGSYVRYAYDVLGRRISVAYGSGGTEQVTRYEYDLRDRVVRTIDPVGAITTQAWDAVGNLIAIGHPNGATTTFDYDSRRRPVAIAHRDPAAALLWSERYTYDAIGNRMRIDRHNGSSVDYQYDLLSRVIRERHVDPAATVVYDASYTYDAAGNMISAGATGSPVSYVYDRDNRLVSAGSISYENDGAGRRVRETMPVQGGGASTVQYTWDARDRLLGFRDATGTMTSYHYDATGLRIGRNGAAGPVDDLIDRASGTGYAQLLERTGAAGVERFVWSDRLLHSDGALGIRYAHHDALGSVRLFTSPGGAEIDRFDYTAYGRVLAQSGTSPAVHGFAGEVTDPESGLVYLRARYYDPRSGRFLSKDAAPGALASPSTLHPYTYASGNPVNVIDPSGNESLVALMVANAERFHVQGVQAARAQRALARTKETLVQSSRAAGGVIGVEAVMEAFSGGTAKIDLWFGAGFLSAAAELADLGAEVGMAVHIAAGVAMARTAIDMLNGTEVNIEIGGLAGLFTSGSIQDAVQSVGGALSAGCSQQKHANALALAYNKMRPWRIELCSGFWNQPLLPTPETLQRPGKASMPGIMLHEFTHLVVRVTDNAYECDAKGLLGILPKLHNLLGLTNADSYRCWAEDVAIGWSGSALNKHWGGP